MELISTGQNPWTEDSGNKGQTVQQIALPFVVLLI